MFEKLVGILDIEDINQLSIWNKTPYDANANTASFQRASPFYPNIWSCEFSSVELFQRFFDVSR